VVSITTDKVYENREWVHAYRETDRLGGHDPYSASKAACEIAISSYRLSYFEGSQVALASARAGNVIGGGDWAEDRIVPDFVRAGLSGQRLQVRNPGALRPWQHVLDPLAGYMLLAQQLYTGKAEVETSFNFGPDAAAQRRVSEVLSSAQAHWPVAWDDKSDPDAVHEANLLSLTTEKAQTILGWKPRWNFDQAVGQTISWYRAVSEGADPAARTTADIERFETAGV
jgi:CDP-glucose 4,6-dehydratase